MFNGLFTYAVPDSDPIPGTDVCPKIDYSSHDLG